MNDETTDIERVTQGGGSDGAEMSEQERVRVAKLERLKSAGVDPYPVSYPRTDSIAEIRQRHPDLPADTATR